MISYQDYAQAKLTDYFKAIRAERLALSVIIGEDWHGKIKHQRAIEWVTTAAMLNLQISRKEFNKKYDDWFLDKEKVPQAPEKKGSFSIENSALF